MPLSSGNAILGSQGVKDELKAFNAMRWQFQCLADGVNEPSQDDFASGKIGIALKELLHGWDMFAVGRVVTIQRAENGVNGVEQFA